MCLIDKIYRKYFPPTFIILKLWLSLKITKMEPGFYNETFRSINYVNFIRRNFTKVLIITLSIFI